MPTPGAPEIEALYDLSIDLFTATNRVGALGEAAGKALKTLGARAGGLVLFRNEAARADIVGVMGENALQPDDPLVETVGRHGETAEVPAEGGARDVYLPVAVGGKTERCPRRPGDPRGSQRAGVGRTAGGAGRRAGAVPEGAGAPGRPAGERRPQDVAPPRGLPRPEDADDRDPHGSRSAAPGRAGRRRPARDGGRRGARDRTALPADRQSPRDGAAGCRHLRAAPRAHAGGRPVSPRDRELSSRARRAAARDPRRPRTVPIFSWTLRWPSRSWRTSWRTPPGPPRPIGRWSSAPSPAPWTPAGSGSRSWTAGPVFQPPSRARQRGDPSGDDSGRGGLGLEICRTLSSAVGGNVALLDRPGGGTIARVDLPASVPTRP